MGIVNNQQWEAYMWKPVVPGVVALVTLGLSFGSGAVIKRGDEPRQELAAVTNVDPVEVTHALPARSGTDAVKTVRPDGAEPRLALVIGNAAYPDAGLPLAQPVNNARSLALTLKEQGFDVQRGENLTKQAMEQTFGTFKDKVRPGATVLVFFSGFAIQAGRETYMVPVNAQIWNEADVRRVGVALEPWLADIHARGAGIKLVVLDASRRNPFERRFRSASTGLAAVHAPDDTLMMYAAAPGKVSGDAEGEISPVVDELIAQIQVPGQNAEEAFNHTRMAISRASQREHVPWVSSSLVDDFFFAPAKTRQSAR